jgi:SAM-dependent methyltransferase
MVDWDEKKDAIAGYYKDLIKEHGHTPRSCDYGRPESQAKKFMVLSDIVTPKHQTLLDIGCGFADYADYLEMRAPHIQYTGVDITTEFVKEAKRKHPDLDVFQMDILSEDLGHFDIVTANGIFYLLGKEAEPLMQKLVTRMFDITLQSVAFNSLSAWCKDQESGEFYADPVKTLEFCRTLTPWVTLRHDYHDRDFTIYMHKEQVG